MKLLETDGVINDYLGDTYYFLGQISKASDFWSKAKLLGSKNNYLDQATEEDWDKFLASILAVAEERTAEKYHNNKNYKSVLSHAMPRSGLTK